MNVRALIAYDGTDYHGFQRQLQVCTVQSVIETALNRVCGQVIGITGAGRTDTGVHATGQVIAFNVNWSHSLIQLQRALNANLPSDVSIRALEACDDRFHPRFSAISRTYEYTLRLDAFRHPLFQRYSWQVSWALNLDDMISASKQLIGEHDFVSFGSPTTGESTIRRVIRANWQEVSASELKFTIEANAFLFRMVRRIVGTLVRIGCGRSSINEINRLLELRNPDLLKGIAPACGLCLVNVSY